MRNITFQGNVFNGINEMVANPSNLSHTQSTASSTWVLDTEEHLPFLGWARVIENYTPNGELTDASNNTVWDAPWFDTEYGSDKRQIRVVWREPTKGSIRYTARMDNPI
jgi:hypothetical protein